ncbi:MAG: PH domain-containing protein [Comamonadaceae bacterium]|nr:MAG: PH domain-containing protein [Comamonadaceae bacterium]
MKAHPQQEHEHEFEAAHGLPEPLPPGERIVWQGAPDWRALALRVMHVRTLAIYFALMLLWRVGSQLVDGAGAKAAMLSIALLLPLALLALGILALLAWLSSRTTVYTLTNKRLVMRIGIVLSVTFNLPLRVIESAALRPAPYGTGDIALTLAPGDRIAYLQLWPHARPWRVRRPEPMLRVIPDAARVGQLLAATAAALADNGRTVQRATPLRAGATEGKPAGHDTHGAQNGPLTA